MTVPEPMTHLILYDCPPDEEFIRGLTEASGVQWEVLYADGRASVPKPVRLFRYILFPLLTLLKKRGISRLLAWQQFYGIFSAIYASLLRKKEIKIDIMTFIYKPRRGVSGRIFRKLIGKALSSPVVQNVFVYSSHEAGLYASIFPEAASKFRPVTLGIDPRRDDTPLASGERTSPYLFSAGRSNRNYEPLKRAAEAAGIQLRIACPEESDSGFAHVKVLHDCFDADLERELNGCFAVAIPLKDKDISSGQLVALQALRAAKPLIVSYNHALMPYIREGENAFVCRDDSEWECKIMQLAANPELCRRMGKEGNRMLRSQFSLRALGANIGSYMKMQ